MKAPTTAQASEATAMAKAEIDEEDDFSERGIDPKTFW